MREPAPRARILAAFESFRSDLLSLAYRMLGDMGRAEEIVQEAWLRWGRHAEDPSSPKAYFVTIVSRLCLNELDSARARREESRADRLPEPVAVDRTSLGRLEDLEEISMALLVVLQRLKAPERAVLLLHDVFDLEYEAIGALVGKSAPACRKLLERARQRVADERRTTTASVDEHARLLRAFLAAAAAGDGRALMDLLAEDAIMISDGGPEGATIAGLRNLPRPLHGATRIAAFVAMSATRNGAPRVEVREVNGRSAAVFFLGSEPVGVLLIAASDGKIGRVFFHADASRLRYLH